MMGLYFDEIEVGRQWPLGSLSISPARRCFIFARAYDPQAFPYRR